jgi:hypothetical protein
VKGFAASIILEANPFGYLTLDFSALICTIFRRNNYRIF